MEPEWAKHTENQQEKQNLTVFENCFSGVTDWSRKQLGTLMWLWSRQASAVFNISSTVTQWNTKTNTPFCLVLHLKHKSQFLILYPSNLPNLHGSSDEEKMQPGMCKKGLLVVWTPEMCPRRQWFLHNTVSFGCCSFSWGFGGLKKPIFETGFCGDIAPFWACFWRLEPNSCAPII